MRMIKMLLILSIIYGLAQSLAVREAVGSTVRGWVTPTTATSITDQQTFDQICPLLDAWTTLDGRAQRRTATTIRILARHGAARTEDPAVQAFLTTVPAALSGASNAKSRAARALVDRECDAHQR